MYSSNKLSGTARRKKGFLHELCPSYHQQKTKPPVVRPPYDRIVFCPPRRRSVMRSVSCCLDQPIGLPADACTHAFLTHPSSSPQHNNVAPQVPRASNITSEALYWAARRQHPNTTYSHRNQQPSDCSCHCFRMHAARVLLNPLIVLLIQHAVRHLLFFFFNTSPGLQSLSLIHI